jgi:septal ring-binding cell division protein DamX
LPAEETEDRFNINGQHIQPKPQQNPQTQQRPSQNPTLQQQQQRPSQNPTIQTQQSNNNFDNVNQFVDDNNVCGVPVVISQSLVVGGMDDMR